MRKLVGAAILALTITTLAGCSAENKVADFHTLVHAIPAYKNMTDTNIDKAAKGVCTLFDADASTGYQLAHDAIIQSGRTESQAVVFVRGSVAAYCPDHTKDIPEDAK